MRVYLGATRSAALVRRLRLHGWGRIFQARTDRDGSYRQINPYPGEPWALDNGAYIDWQRGRPFDDSDFRRRLGGLVAQVDRGIMPEPSMCVLPDLPTRGGESLEFSVGWAERMESLGVAEWPWYLAVQDRMLPEIVDQAHTATGFSGVFLGGSNGFKAQASAWRAWAHERRLPFHYARAGTAGKVAHALEVGADSLDTSFPLWTMARFELFEECIKLGPPQYDLLWS